MSSPSVCLSHLRRSQPPALTWAAATAEPSSGDSGLLWPQPWCCLIRQCRTCPRHPPCLPGQGIFLVPSLTRDSARNTRAMPGICHSRAGGTASPACLSSGTEGSPEVCPGPSSSPWDPSPLPRHSPRAPLGTASQQSTGTCPAQVGELRWGSCTSTQDWEPGRNKRRQCNTAQTPKIETASLQGSSHIPISLAWQKQIWELANEGESDYSISIGAAGGG